MTVVSGQWSVVSWFRAARDWVASWLSLPRRWREYRQLVEMNACWAQEHRALANEMGYQGSHHLEASVKIARRCYGAELALKKLAEAEERELAAIGLPGLTAAEMERLAMLAEECGEVVQAVGKVLRHGYQSASPFGGPVNRVALEREIGNVRAVVGLMIDARDVRLGDIQHWQRSKRAVFAKWTHHQGQ